MKQPPYLTALTAQCPTLGEVVVKNDGLMWYATDHECDMCGSHGDVTVSFSCECGEYHEVEVYSW